MIVSYNEIALSSIAFGKGGIMLDAVYGREYTIKGVKSSQEIVKLIIDTKKKVTI